METTRLGRSDLQVSRICLGTMTFGEQNTEAEGHSQLDYAVSRGINFIDTAEMYPVKPRAETYGSTERIVGTWLKRQQRERIVLATKVAGPARMPWIRNGGDLTPDSIRAAVDASLARLQTDYIDLYQIHWPARNAPIFGQKQFDPANERECASIQAQLEAMGELVRAGKIRYVGVSNETPWGVAEFVKQAELHGLPRIATIQNPYNLLNRSFEQGLDEACFRTDVSLLVYSPLAFGQLTGKYLGGDLAHPVFDAQAKGRLTRFPPDWSPRYLRPESLAAAARYVTLAREHGLSPATLALAWSYSRWFAASTIIGATSLEQLRENIDAWQTPLPEAVTAAIARIHAEIHNPAQ
ncbi:MULTISPECIES: aldo/keto reductase [Cupriavidus]|uniref:aldo/keto reductase n=1 Tax=Cupriavidus TaxID=106589 RepID=UPI001600A0E7|nr:MULTISPECIES: aldo/keto reductase [Cupriavidus]MBB1630098.1 aldo/keto reductase [Cupriavidus sp. UME77]MCP3021089.1 aldo/keto reductase [Cupriavidus basilensis]